jgi:hypothetical protein
LLGLVWPFLMAGLGVWLVAIDEFTAFRAGILLAVSFQGCPVLIGLLTRYLPAEWPLYARVMGSILFVVPWTVVEVYVAYLTFWVGYLAVGGWIPA